MTTDVSAVADAPKTTRAAEGTDAFDVPPHIAYYNTANLCPQLRTVQQAGAAAMSLRGAPWSIDAEDWFTDVERLRSLFAALVHGDSDGVALVPATSYGFAVAAANLPLHAGQRVLVLDEEYPSGIYTWRRATRAVGADILTVKRQDGQTWTEAILANLDERVAIVSVPNVHWTDGALIDLGTVSQRARDLGAALVIDGSQSVGAMDLDVASIQPDFLVTVGYKWLLGPFGVGYLYVAEQHRQGDPLEENWILREDSQDFARLTDYRDGYQPGARRFDVGERTKFETVPMAIAALEQLHHWGVEHISRTLASVTQHIAAHATGLGFDPLPPEQRGPHMLGVRLPEAMADPVLAGLADADCYASIRAGSLRIAPHLHITDAHLDQLAGALNRVVDQAKSS